jgi:hypothetical protein
VFITFIHWLIAAMRPVVEYAVGKFAPAQLAQISLRRRVLQRITDLVVADLIGDRLPDLTRGDFAEVQIR